MITLLVILVCLVVLLGGTLVAVFTAARRERYLRIQAEVSRDKAVAHMHAVGNSAMRGCPVVRWRRPYPVPEGQPAVLDRVLIEGEVHLFPSEVRAEARRLANNLLPSGRAVLPEPVAKRDKPRPVGEIPTE